jgi:hypothetical protein
MLPASQRFVAFGMSQATNRFIRGIAENSHTRDRLPWKSVHPTPRRWIIASVRGSPILRCSARRKKVSNKAGRRKILLKRFCRTQLRIARFSPAVDVLPFHGLLTSPDQVRLSNLQNNNSRSRQAA